MAFWYAGAVLSFGILTILHKRLPPNVLAAQVSARSNHQGNPRQLGGLAIYPCILLAWMFSGSAHAPFQAPILAGLSILFLLGLLDDLYGLSWLMKLALQLGCAALILLPLAIAQSWPWLLVPVAVVILAYWINAVNFMDGMDWMLALGLGIPLFFLSFSLSQSILTETQAPFAIPTQSGLWACGGLIGFAIWNKPPARIFMGDSGSLLLGGVSGAVIVSAASIWGLAAALIPFSYFLYDTVFTIIKRALDGENVFQAHSRHAYQMALRGGRGIWQILAGVSFITILLCGISYAAMGVTQPVHSIGLSLVALMLVSVFHALLKRNPS